MFAGHRIKLIRCLILTLTLLQMQTSRAQDSPPLIILSPGEGSLVTSPIYLDAEITASPVSMLRTVLIDRNGNSLARQLLRADQWVEGETLNFETLIPFDIPESSMEALLTLTALDEYFRPIVTRAVAVTLISTSSPTLQTPQPEIGWLSLTDPQPLKAYRGGEIQVRGMVSPLTDKPVVIELISSAGRVVGSTQLQVNRSGVPFEFDLTLPYSWVKTSTDTRLVVRQAADPYETDAVLDSLVITLLP